MAKERSTNPEELKTAVLANLEHFFEKLGPRVTQLKITTDGQISDSRLEEEEVKNNYLQQLKGSDLAKVQNAIRRGMAAWESEMNELQDLLETTNEGLRQDKKEHHLTDHEGENIPKKIATLKSEISLRKSLLETASRMITEVEGLR